MMIAARSRRHKIYGHLDKDAVFCSDHDDCLQASRVEVEEITLTYRVQLTSQLLGLVVMSP